MTISQDLFPELNWLDGRDQEMIDLVERLCNQNSGTFHREGIQAVETMLVQALQPLDGKLCPVPVNPVETIDDQGQKVVTELGPAILLVKRPELRPQILLCIHMDTVYARDDAFQSCRWLPDGRLNGPGVIDAKGGLVVMLYALRAFEQSPLAQHLGWKVFINPDEEIGSPGTSEFMKTLAQESDLGLLFEPELPSGSLVSWRKGSGNFSFVVHGKAAHAGRDFQQGKNAVAAMSRLMVAIDEFNGDPDVTFNVGRVSGGGALNIVPDLAIGRINVRVRNLAQQRQVEQQLHDLVAEFNRRWPGIRVEMHGSFTSPPKEISATTEKLMRRIEACGDSLSQPIAWQGSGGASDGNKFAAAGLPNIDSLGPAGGAIHSHQEFLVPDSLVKKAKLTALILLSLADEYRRTGALLQET